MGLAERQAAAYEALAAEAKEAWERYSALARDCRDLLHQSRGSESVGQAERLSEPASPSGQSPLPNVARMVASMSRYATIVADPPWPIAWRGSASIGKKPLSYPTLTIAEIVELPVRKIALDASNLYLWTTNQFLPEALGVVRAWGFQYRMLWTWCKNNGIGGHPRNATEHIVIASRGETPTLGRHAPMTLNWLATPRLQHSEKPEAFMDMIERFSPAPRIELFARRRRMGWDAWGNEIESDLDWQPAGFRVAA